MGNDIEEMKDVNGIEDVKLFHNKNDNKIYYTGTKTKENEEIGVCFGEYSIEDKFISFTEINNKQFCERNWVLINFNEKNEPCFIHSWNPLKIGHLVENELKIENEIETPQFFNYFRGSSNCFEYENELWFVTHIVIHNEKRKEKYIGQRNYYHSIVILDIHTYNIKRYTIPFKFSPNNTEYCLGLIVEDERVIMTHSVADNTSFIKVYDKNYIDSLFCF